MSCPLTSYNYQPCYFQVCCCRLSMQRGWSFVWSSPFRLSHAGLGWAVLRSVCSVNEALWKRKEIGRGTGNAFYETTYSVCHRSSDICSYKRNKRVCRSVQGDLSTDNRMWTSNRCVCVCIYIYIYIYVCMYMYMYMYMYIYVYRHVEPI
jgi:hypothetical protein